MSLEINHQLSKITSSTGVIKVDNSGAISLAVGNTAERPSLPVEGMTRFNTDASNLEFYNGSSWTSGFSSLTGGTGFITGNGSANLYKSIVGTTGITVSNPQGIAGDPEVSLNANIQDVLNTAISAPQVADIIAYNGTSWINTQQIGLRNLTPAGDFYLNPFQNGKGRFFAPNSSYEDFQYGTSILSGQRIADRFFTEFSMGAPLDTGIGRGIVYLSNDLSGLGKPLTPYIQIKPWGTAFVPVTPTASQYFTTFRTVIEGYDFTRISDRPFTISFWASWVGNPNSTACLSITNFNKDRSIVFDVPLSNGQRVYSITVPAINRAVIGGLWNMSNNIGLDIRLTLAAGSSHRTPTTGSWVTGDFRASSNITNPFTGSSATLAFSQIQVIPGSNAVLAYPETATSVLRHCQRYYETSFEINQPFGVDTPVMSAISAKKSKAFNGTAFYDEGVVRYRENKARQPQSITIIRPSNGATGLIETVAGGSPVTPDLFENGLHSYNLRAVSGLTSGSDYQWHWISDTGL